MSGGQHNGKHFTMFDCRTTLIVFSMVEINWSLLFEIIGWIGSLAILLAYALNSYQKLRSDSLAFLVLNLTGGLLLMVYTFYKDALANTFLNFVWVIVAIVALIKMYNGRAAKNSS
jgi:hypothetical protein